MLEGKIVLAKVKGVWHSGIITGGKLKRKKKIKGRLKDVKEGFLSLGNYRSQYSPETTRESFLEKYGFDGVYIKEEDQEVEKESTVAKIEARWWKKLNKMCLMCSMACKQSAKITIIKCKSYSKKGNGTNAGRTEAG